MPRIGDTVGWRGCWGSQPPTPARITALELCQGEHQKYGEPVDSVTWSQLRRCCVSLDNGHWCYGYQLDNPKRPRPNRWYYGRSY